MKKYLLMILLFTPHLVFAEEAPLNLALGEHIVRIPTKLGIFGSNAELVTTLFSPPGAGPFPVVVINHGANDLSFPSAQPRARYLFATLEFLRRGYVVVLPNRRGFAGSGGSQQSCSSISSMADHGRDQADDIIATLDWVTQQKWADKNQFLIVGQSHGGLATLAMSERNYPGLKGLINFAGGLKCSPKVQFDWEGGMIKAAGDYGKKAAVPMLWLYGENDPNFKPELAAKMFDSFTNAGGKGRLFAFGKFYSNGHRLLSSNKGAQIWGPEVDQYLIGQGLPAQKVIDIPMSVAWNLTPIPPATSFAKLNNANALPGLDEAGRKAYKSFLGKVPPRAFAIGSDGAWGTAWLDDGVDPLRLALERCKEKSGDDSCRLYAVDEEIVWPLDMQLAESKK